jgi:opine dehydrogenase
MMEGVAANLPPSTEDELHDRWQKGVSRMSEETEYTVIGAGHGGKAMAAHLALMGFPVTLYNRTAEHMAGIRERGGIELRSYKGGPQGFAQLALVTSDLGEALEQARVIMVAVPSTAHRDFASRAARRLRDGQIVVLNPGRTGGAIEFSHMLHRRSCSAEVTVAEAQYFVYDSLSSGPAEVFISRMRNVVPLAALPADRTPQVLDALKGPYPQFVDGVNVLHTSLNNVLAVLHPALALANAGRIESTAGEFAFYVEGVSPSVARLLELVDAERVAVARALGVEAETAMQWLETAYHSRGDDLRQAIHNNPAFRDIRAPRTLNHRYILEDVPMTLVPIVGLGRRHGVSVKGMDGVIRMACIMHGTDFRRRGRSLRKLGMARLSAAELMVYVNEGVLYGRAA